MGEKGRSHVPKGLLVNRAETDKTKTYRVSVVPRRLLYISLGSIAVLYIILLIMVTVIEYDPAGMLRLHIVLFVFLPFIYLFIRMSRNRISFHETHLLCHGGNVGRLRHHIPWVAVKEIVVENSPPCKVVLHYTNAKNRPSRIEIPIHSFLDQREIIELLKETAEKKGIPLREV